MKAVPLFHQKYEFDDGALVEMAIWSVPEAVLGSRHRLKYGLYFGKSGKRIVGYDNERGKGDHRHLGDRELPYRFVSPDKLIQDFLADVRAARRQR